jgi:flagellar motor switch protein FliN
MPVLSTTNSTNAAATKPPSAPAKNDVGRILKLSVPVIVKLAERRISLQEVLRLSNGSIIEFYKSSDDALELLINNKAIGLGAAVKVGENFGIRLTQIGDVRAIVQAMGSR